MYKKFEGNEAWSEALRVLFFMRKPPMPKAKKPRASRHSPQKNGTPSMYFFLSIAPHSEPTQLYSRKKMGVDNIILHWLAGGDSDVPNLAYAKWHLTTNIKPPIAKAEPATLPTPHPIGLIYICFFFFFCHFPSVFYLMLPVNQPTCYLLPPVASSVKRTQTQTHTRTHNKTNKLGI